MIKFALQFFAAGAMTLAGVLPFTHTANAQSIQCGSRYTIQSGDTLSLLAQRTYGNPQAFTFIYTANSSVIGPNPSLVKEGSRLDIPCLDEQGSSAAPVLQEVRSVERLPFPNQRQIRVLTGTDWAPFTDEDQEQGGMLVEMVNVALSKSDSQPEYKIDFINDWGAHLTPLLTDHAYDLSIAWYQPNCDVIDQLGEDNQFRCNNFNWSEPIYEQIMGYYIRSSDPVPQSYAEMKGKTICRPAGYSLFFLEENGLTEKLEQPVQVADCMRGLHDGSYDIVVLAPEVAEVAMNELGVTDKTVYLEKLAKVLPIGAVISKNHPDGDSILREFNTAMQQIKSSGEWFRIVLRHLQEHKANTQ